MIETQDMRLDMALDEAIQKAGHHHTKQLISFTEQIEPVDPVQFFTNAKSLKLERTFWSSTAESFYMVGVGDAQSLIAHDNRFTKTKEDWEAVLEHAMIANPYQAPGTGLVAMGGMRFDPQKSRSPLWKNFAESDFRIPQLVLVKSESASYITVNTVVDAMDDAKLSAKHIQTTLNGLLKDVMPYPEEATLESITEVAPEQWKEQIRLATESIKQGEAKKIVLARELRLKLSDVTAISPLLNKLLAAQTNSYVFAIEHGEDCFIGATPERLVKITGDQLLSTCLAGTAPRGETPTDDQMIGQALLKDEKNLGEHDFVVQMIRQAMTQYCVDIAIPEKPVLYPLKNLQHLYTPVTATLKSGYSIFDIVEALHPTPALGGVPREQSLSFIREHEALERGWYGAPIGWLDSNQNGEFAVAIRSGLVQGDEASLFAGCGIVKDSDPEAEYRETAIKFKPMLSVFGG